MVDRTRARRRSSSCTARKYIFSSRPGRRHPGDAHLVRGTAVEPSHLTLGVIFRLSGRSRWVSTEVSRSNHCTQPLPLAAQADPRLYELLALLDALRDGRARERSFAKSEIVKRIRERPNA